MTYWVTLSNNHQVCQCLPYQKLIKWAEENDYPIIHDKHVVGGKYLKNHDIDEELVDAREAEELRLLDEELDEYIKSRYIKTAKEDYPTMKSRESLPYAAYPLIGSERQPQFCSSPKECKGRSSCPKSYACSE